MPVRHYTRIVDKQSTDGPKARYSPKQKLEAVTSYLILGKIALVAGALNIPEETLRLWKATDWWKEMEQEVRTSSRVEVSGRLSRIIEKSMNVVEDRLEHGDFQYNPKTGQFSRKPVGAKTAGDILIKAIDKQVLLEKIDKEPQADTVKIEDRLKAIQDKLIEFSRFSKAKTINVGDYQNVEDSVASNQVALPTPVGESGGQGQCGSNASSGQSELGGEVI